MHITRKNKAQGDNSAAGCNVQIYMASHCNLTRILSLEKHQESIKYFANMDTTLGTCLPLNFCLNQQILQILSSYFFLQSLKRNVFAKILDTDLKSIILWHMLLLPFLAHGRTQLARMELKRSCWRRRLRIWGTWVGWVNGIRESMTPGSSKIPPLTPLIKYTWCWSGRFYHQERKHLKLKIVGRSQLKKNKTAVIGLNFAQALHKRANNLLQISSFQINF